MAAVAVDVDVNVVIVVVVVVVVGVVMPPYRQKFSQFSPVIESEDGKNAWGEFSPSPLGTYLSFLSSIKVHFKTVPPIPLTTLF